MNGMANNSPTSMFHVFQTWGKTDAAANGNYGTGNSNAEHLRRNVLISDDIREEAFNNYALNSNVIRVGEAWENAQTEYGYNLHQGDGSHGNASGYYLAAATIFQNILNEEDPSARVGDLGYNPFTEIQGQNLLSSAVSLSDVATVPEPTSTVLSVMGGLILCLRRRRSSV